MRKVLVLVILLTFIAGVAGLALATEIKGTITKIDGNKLTIKQADGKEVTVEVKDAKGLKVGDTVTVKDKVATKVEKKKKAIEGC